MRKITYMDNSDFIEGVSELADRKVRETFGDAGYVLAEPNDPDAGTVYSEEAQDLFNEEYDNIEADINQYFALHAEIDKGKPVKNILFTIEVQDGERKRYEYRLLQFLINATKDEINAKGEELVKESFSGDAEDEWYWDSSFEIMGRYYTYNEVSDETFEFLQRIGI